MAGVVFVLPTAGLGKRSCAPTDPREGVSGTRAQNTLLTRRRDESGENRRSQFVGDAALKLQRAIATHLIKLPRF
ncbi:protein of unknown function (plasmid) [Pararobbsia alpina]